MPNKKYDFGGWATKNDIKCSDGRTIKKGCFKHQDGLTVPMVYNHNHVDSDNVLGHALLEDREEGVYAYCSFNDTEKAKNAKEMVKHGDICALSICATQLKQNGKDVIHGMIREVSLVLAGANPGALIDNVMIHNAETNEDSVNFEEAVIYHSEVDGEIIQDPDKEVKETPEDEAAKKEAEEKAKKEAEEAAAKKAAEEEAAKKAAEEEAAKKAALEHSVEDKETVAEIFNTLNEKQKTVVYAMLAKAAMSHSETSPKEEKEMKHNVFQNQKGEDVTLEHSDLLEVISTAKKGGSLKEAFKDMCDSKGISNEELEHSITNIENFFPEYQNVTKTPKVVDIEHNWVAVIMNGVKHSPFSRVKSTYATLTADEARAKGYVKGNQKTEEVLVAAKRTTDPQTIYKKQALDRDDVIDITDFDVVLWIKGEMRTKLEEELARAILVGDGRSASSDDKISESHIRSIANDSNVFSIQKAVATADADDKQVASDLIDETVMAMEDYMGSGNLTMFVRRNVLSRMLLLKDVNGRRIYKDEKELATAMLVNRIVSVPTNVMGDVLAIAIDLSDYNIGADKGGKATLFEDFDIDWNKEKYLIETRCSGANVTPYSAIVFKKAVAAAE